MPSPRTESERKNRAAKMPIAPWFEKHVDKSGSCWIWTRGKDVKGYGRIWIGHKHEVASRFAYQLWVGPIPDGMFVCHRCDNPPCCNPEHLFLGTARDNQIDKMNKGRFYNGVHTGETNSSAKLKTEHVLEIRESKLTTRELAQQFGVSYGHINKIRRGALWRCV